MVNRFTKTIRAAAGLLVLGWPILLVAADRFDLEDTLTRLGYEKVELRRTGDNHLFLFGKVEGRKRSCLVDTGWSFTTVTTNTAARLKETNFIRQLELGRVVLTNESVVAQDLRVNGQPTSYDVVLGCDFLLRHHAVLDAAGRRLYLRSTTLTPPERTELDQAWRAADWGEVELKRYDPLALTCQAKIHEQAVELLVDSGAAWSCLDQKVVETLNLRAWPTLSRLMGPAAAGPRKFAVTNLKSWQLGSRPMAETSMAVFSLKEWGLGPEGQLFKDVGGILGGAELLALRAVLVFDGPKLWLRNRR